MRLVSFKSGADHHSWGVIRDGTVIDVPGLAAKRGEYCPNDVAGLLAGSSLEWLSGILQESKNEDLNGLERNIEDVRIRPPIRPGKIVAVGRNYLDHAGEANVQLPKWPKLFPKFPSTVIGQGDEIVSPTMTDQLDFEVEVGVVISATAAKVTEDAAMSHVAGYTIINDVSARDIQFTDEQITLGKNFDTFCPMGPVITTTDEMLDPGAIDLRLRLNGDLMQESSTKNLIFSIPFLISFISYAMTLEPGDIISTGTPAGVGCFRNPPVWLAPGDHLESEVTGVGTLLNTVVPGNGEVPVRTSSDQSAK